MNSRKKMLTLIEVLVAIVVIAILVALILPAFVGIVCPANKSFAMSNAKQIGLALKNFAIDYNGAYPSWIDPIKKTPSSVTALPNSNAVLVTLIPDYIADEQVFGIPRSKWLGKNGPDGNITNEGNKLEAGENAWAYVAGLRDESDPRWPVLVNAFAQTSGNLGSRSNPYFVADDTPKNFLSQGRKAVVLRCDGSANLENTYKGSSNRFTVKRDDDPKKNAFTYDAKAHWLTPDCAVLQPIPPPE